MREALQPQTVDYLEGLLEGFVAYDENWVLTYMNAAGERLLGRRREEVIGKTWHQAFPHAVGNPVDQMYQRVMRTRSPERMEYHYAHYGRWFEISASPVGAGGIAVYFRDISDREALNRIGRALTAELDLERVVQAATDAAREVSGAQFGAFFYNQKNEAGEAYMLYTLSGVPREAFAGFPMPRNTAVFAPTFSGECIVRSDDITRDPRYGRSAPHHGMPQGHLPVKSYLALPVVSRSGEVLGALFFGHPDRGVFTERAERLVAGIASQAAIAIDNARLYRRLQESEERFRNVVEAQSEMVCRFRVDGTLLFVNSAYARAVGSTPEQMIGKDFWGFIPAADHAQVRALLERLTPQAPEVRIENRFETAEGARWTLWANRALAFDGEGRVVEAQSTGFDITARKEAEQALRASEERFRAFTSASFDVVYSMSPDWTEMRYLQGREFIADTPEPSRSWLDKYIHPDDQQRVMDAIGQAVRTKSMFELEHRVIRADGTLGWTHSRALPIVDPRGEIVEWFGAASDVTARKTAEAELLAADRRKDEFLAILAHELRNPLAPIRNGLHLLRVSPAGSPAADEARAMMERQLNHLIRLVDDLLEVSRISRGKIELRRAPVELAHAVASAVETSRPVLEAARHRLEVRVPPAPLVVEADLVRLSQIIANLLNNAAKYSEPGGRIALDVRREEREAVISVRDNGIGIPAELLPHVFDMFAQADRARTQGGLGIGLSLARRLTELHGGRIEARSDGPGQGSEFIVRLPA